MTNKYHTGPEIVEDDALDGVVGGARVAMVKFAVPTDGWHTDDDDPDADKPVARVFDVAWDVEPNVPS